MIKVEVAEESFYKDIKPANEGILLIVFALIIAASIFNLHITSKENKRIATILVKNLDKYKKLFDKSYSVYKKTLQNDLRGKLKPFLSDKFGKCTLRIDELLVEKEYLEKYTNVLVELIKSTYKISPVSDYTNSVPFRFGISIENLKIEGEKFDNIFSLAVPKIYDKNGPVSIETKDGNWDDDNKVAEMEYWLYINTFISDNDIKELKVLLKDAESKAKS